MKRLSVENDAKAPKCESIDTPLPFKKEPVGMPIPFKNDVDCEEADRMLVPFNTNVRCEEPDSIPFPFKEDLDCEEPYGMPVPFIKDVHCEEPDVMPFPFNEDVDCKKPDEIPVPFKEDISCEEPDGIPVPFMEDVDCEEPDGIPVPFREDVDCEEPDGIPVPFKEDVGCEAPDGMPGIFNKDIDCEEPDCMPVPFKEETLVNESNPVSLETAEEPQEMPVPFKEDTLKMDRVQESDSTQYKCDEKIKLVDVKVLLERPNFDKLFNALQEKRAVGSRLSPLEPMPAYKKGSVFVTYMKYPYCVRENKPAGTSYRCPQKQCEARIYVRRDRKYVLEHGHHRHPPDTWIRQRNILYQELNRRAASEITPLKQIYREEAARYPEGAAHLPFKESSMRLWRRKSGINAPSQRQASGGGLRRKDIVTVKPLVKKISLEAEHTEELTVANVSELETEQGVSVSTQTITIKRNKQLKSHQSAAYITAGVHRRGKLISSPGKRKMMNLAKRKTRLLITNPGKKVGKAGTMTGKRIGVAVKRMGVAVKRKTVGKTASENITEPAKSPKKRKARAEIIQAKRKKVEEKTQSLPENSVNAVEMSKVKEKNSIQNKETNVNQSPGKNKTNDDSSADEKDDTDSAENKSEAKLTRSNVEDSWDKSVIQIISPYHVGSTWIMYKGYPLSVRERKLSGTSFVCPYDGCRMRIYIRNDSSDIDEHHAHAHEPQAWVPQRNALYQVLKNRTMSETTPMKVIYDEEAERFPEGAKHLPYKESSMRLWRKGAFPKVPSRLWEYTGTCLAKVTCEEKTAVILTCGAWAAEAAAAEAVVADGACGALPPAPELRQLLALHALRDGRSTCPIIVLMEAKSPALYRAVFAKIREHVTFAKVESVYTGYDDELNEALEVLFPGVPVKGYFFHYAQGVVRLAKRSGVNVHGKHNKRIISMLLGAALLPAARMRGALDYVRSDAAAPAAAPAAAVAPAAPELDAFLDAYYNYWVEHVGLERISVFGEPDRTSNVVEMFQATLASRLSAGKLDWWNFIHSVEYMQKAEPPNARYTSWLRNTDILKQRIKLKKKEINLYEYLQKVAKILKINYLLKEPDGLYTVKREVDPDKWVVWKPTLLPNALTKKRKPQKDKRAKSVSVLAANAISAAKLGSSRNSSLGLPAGIPCVQANIIDKLNSIGVITISRVAPAKIDEPVYSDCEILESDSELEDTPPTKQIFVESTNSCGPKADLLKTCNHGTDPIAEYSLKGSPIVKDYDEEDRPIFNIWLTKTIVSRSRNLTSRATSPPIPKSNQDKTYKTNQGALGKPKDKDETSNDETEIDWLDEDASGVSDNEPFKDEDVLISRESTKIENRTTMVTSFRTVQSTATDAIPGLANSVYSKSTPSNYILLASGFSDNETLKNEDVLISRKSTNIESKNPLVNSVCTVQPNATESSAGIANSVYSNSTLSNPIVSTLSKTAAETAPTKDAKLRSFGVVSTKNFIPVTPKGTLRRIIIRSGSKPVITTPAAKSPHMVPVVLKPLTTAASTIPAPKSDRLSLVPKNESIVSMASRPGVTCTTLGTKIILKPVQKRYVSLPKTACHACVVNIGEEKCMLCGSKV